MAASEVTGFVASALVLLTFAMSNMRALRFTAILSNVAFITYAAIHLLMPVLLLHLLLLPINVMHLARLNLRERQKRCTTIVASEKAARMAMQAIQLSVAARSKPRRAPTTSPASMPWATEGQRTKPSVPRS